MDKINRILEKVLAFIDKNSTIVIVIAVALLGAKYFTSLFSMFKDNNEEKSKQQEAHTAALVTTVKKVPPKTTDPKKEAVRKQVLKNNVVVTSAKFDATVAEEIRKHTTWRATGDYGWFETPKSMLEKLASQIKKYKGNMPNIAAEYKKAFNDDMYADVRSIMGADYVKWLSTATSQ